MGVNKVEYGGETLIDLTKDSVTPETLAEGVTATNAQGEKIVGTLNLDAYQKKTDRGLHTASKEIVGAINELHQQISEGGEAGGYYSERLQYSLSDDGTYYSVTGRGSCSDTYIVIPSEFNGIPVKKIGSNAFNSHQTLVSVIIPDSVTDIEFLAFADCPQLTTVHIPNSVTTIGSYVLRNCPAIQTIIIPNSVTSMGSPSFDNCPSLTIYCEATVRPDGWPANWNKNCKAVAWGYVDDFFEITDRLNDIDPATRNSSGLEYTLSDVGTYYTLSNIGSCKDSNIVIAREYQGLPVKEIGNSALYHEGYITSVEIPDTIIHIGNFAFYGCSSLTSIKIPDSVTSIGDGAFQACDSLTSVEIPDSVTNIGASAFQGCDLLKNISIPHSVTSIGMSAFDGCSSLTSIIIPNSVTSVGQMFAYPSTIHIYCEAESKPDGWDTYWNTYRCPVTWGFINDFVGVNEKLIKRSEMGANNGVATLDENGHVPSTQLPSYVDDVIEGYINSSRTVFYSDSAKTQSITAETGKIYLDISTLKTYRWGGTKYAEISESLALGETSTTAFAGDKGKTAYEHSQKTNSNPHGVTKEHLNLGNVENKSSATIRSEITKENVTNALGYTPSEGVDTSDLQPKTDETLTTKSKEVVGAINELHSKHKVIDLTGRTLNVPKGWVATEGYGEFNIEGIITYTYDNGTVNGPDNFKKFVIGYRVPSNDDIFITYYKDVGSRAFTYYQFTIEITGGADATNPKLIDWFYENDIFQPIDLFEINKNTVDKITLIDTAFEGVENLRDDGVSGIIWDDIAEIDVGETTHYSDIHQRVPIVAGENVTFEVDEENQVVKINATGGGSSSGGDGHEMPQIRFVGMPCDGLFGYVNTAALDGGDGGVVGTWRLNPTVTIPSNSYFNLHFTNDGNEYGVIEFNEDSGIMWYSEAEGDYDNEVYNNGFDDSSYMLLEVLDEPDDWEVSDWLMNNADRVGETYDSDLKFTIEIVGGGALQVGDTIQICRMGLYGACSTTNTKTGKMNYHPEKRKLRSMFDYEITEDDLDKRFITFEVSFNRKTQKLFTLQPIWNTSNETPIYFRIRRPKGNFNYGNVGYPRRTVDAKFSNVVSVKRTSMHYCWDDDGEEIYFYQIRIM